MASEAEIQDFFEEFDEYSDNISQARHQDFARWLRQWFDVLERAPDQISSRFRWLEKQFSEDRLESEIMIRPKGMVGSGQLNWPDKIDLRLAAQIHLLRRLSKTENAALSLANTHFWENNAQANGRLNGLTTHFFNPHHRELKRYLKRNLNDPPPLNSNKSVPASDRIVSINHNSSDYEQFITGLEGLEDQLNSSNSISPEDRDRSIAELNASKTLLSSDTVRESVITGFILTVLYSIGSLLFDTIGASIVEAQLIPLLKSLFPFVAP